MLTFKASLELCPSKWLQKEQLPPWEAVATPFVVLLLGHLSAMSLPSTKEETEA